MERSEERSLLCTEELQAKLHFLTLLQHNKFLSPILTHVFTVVFLQQLSFHKISRRELSFETSIYGQKQVDVILMSTIATKEYIAVTAAGSQQKHLLHRVILTLNDVISWDDI